MTPRKSYAGFTGLELLSLVTNDCSPVVINFESVVLIPRTMPFSNRAEIASVYSADYIGVQRLNRDTGRIEETLIEIERNLAEIPVD